MAVNKPPVTGDNNTDAWAYETTQRLQDVDSVTAAINLKDFTIDQDENGGFNIVKEGTTLFTIDANGNITPTGNINSTGNININGNRVLTVADEGAGNGLDADTLDGVQGSNYATFYNNVYLNDSASTASFISELTNEYNAFQNNYVIIKTAWSYAGNSNLVTGHPTLGTLELAGCVVEAWGGTYKHVRITRPNTGTGGKKIAVYNDQGSSYSPGWREIFTDASYSTDHSGVNGYVKLPNGIYIQWGRKYLTSNAGQTLTWNIAFPTECFSAFGNDTLNADRTANIAGGTISRTSWTSINPASTGTYNWVAFGD